MQLIEQGPHDYHCGHACVAMLANTTIEAVVAMLGHRRPTTWTELYSVLFTLGVVGSHKMTPVFSPEGLPPVAVVTLPSGSPVLKHVVVVRGGLVYDPAAGGTYPVETLPYCDRPASEVLRCAEIKNVGYAPPDLILSSDKETRE